MNRQRLQRTAINIFIASIVTTLLLFLTLRICEIEIKGTITTKYIKTEDTGDIIIDTKYFRILTPRSWIHIFSGHGIEGDPYGYFWTRDGLISYEYGRYGPDYDKDNDSYKYKVSKRRVNRFLINIAINDKNETGIAIPLQNEMDRTMTFYISKSMTANLEELLNAIGHLEFKKSD